MNVNLQKTIPGGGNSGTCRAFVTYLEHETREKIALGMGNLAIPLYDRDGRAVAADTVIQAIDGNHKNLHCEDAKFFSIVFSPSQEEEKYLGDTRAEQLASLHRLVEANMDTYAKGFGREGVANHHGLMYYYTIHEYRKEDAGENILKPGMHVHVIVARNDATGKYKLSPRTNHRRGGGQTAAIKNGFDRTRFFRKCESNFDELFGYHRPVEQSFEYCNALVHGPAEKRREMIGKAVHEAGIEESVRDALASVARRLAQEAAETKRKEDQEEWQRMKAEERENLRRRNTYWNMYHSVYKPQLDSLCRACTDAFTVYRNAKQKYNLVNADLEKKYAELHRKCQTLKTMQRRMQGLTGAKYLYRAMILSLVTGNAIGLLLSVFLLAMYTVIRIDNGRLAQQDVRSQIAGIVDDIEKLKNERTLLQVEKDDNRRLANELKEKQLAFRTEITRLKDELAKPISAQPKQTKSLQSLAQEYANYRIEKSLQSGKPNDRRQIADTIIDILRRTSSINRLESTLTANGCIGFSPVTDQRGYVLDFEMVVEGKVQRASSFCKDDQFVKMLIGYCNLSGQTPAAMMRIVDVKERHGQGEQRKKGNITKIKM